MARDEYSCAGASVVYDRQDCVESVALRELGDQVHSDDLEWLCFRGDIYAIQRDLGSVRKDFVLLAGSTAFDILGDPVTHAWPPIPLRYVFVRLVSTGVSGCYRIVIDPQDFSFEWIFGWDGRLQVVFACCKFVCIRCASVRDLLRLSPVFQEFWVFLLCCDYASL